MLGPCHNLDGRTFLEALESTKNAGLFIAPSLDIFVDDACQPLARCLLLNLSCSLDAWDLCRRHELDDSLYRHESGLGAWRIQS